MKVIITRVSKVITEHDISENALEQYKLTKGSQPIDNFCSGDSRLVSRTVTYERSIVYDDRNIRILEVTN